MKKTSQVQNNNQIQLATIIAAHYTASRNSIDEWVRRRDQYMIIYITGVGTDVGFYLHGPAAEATILLLIAPLTILVLLAFANADIHIKYFSRWLRVEYTSILETYVARYGVAPLRPWHWDNSASVSEYYSNYGASLRYWSVGIVFVIANFTGIFLPQVRGSGWNSKLVVAWSLGTFVLCAFIILLYKQRKRDAERVEYK
jgi:hypothetical protein